LVEAHRWSAEFLEFSVLQRHIERRAT
jgi:hypothetical protein